MKTAKVNFSISEIKTEIAEKKRIERVEKRAAKAYQRRWEFVRTRLDKLRSEFGQEFGKGGGCDYYIFNSLKSF